MRLNNKALQAALGEMIRVLGELQKDLDVLSHKVASLDKRIEELETLQPKPL